MKTIFLALSIFLLLGTQNSQAQSEENLIRETLNKYIEGSTNGKPALLKDAFYGDLNLYYIRNNNFAVWSGKDYILDTKEGQPTGESGKILYIDFEKDAAVAKVEISNPKNSTPYTDYFMLLKVDGTWTIIHKMFTKKSSTNAEADKELIHKSLMDYIDGTANGEPDRLRRAFHPDFNLYSINNENGLNVWSGKSYIDNVREGRKSNRIGKVISINYDNDAAIAKAEIRMPDRKRLYTDYFLLLKIKGEWKIVHKSFTFKTY